MINPCKEHPNFDHMAEPEQRHYVLCPLCAQALRKLEYKRQKEQYENSTTNKN